MDSKNYRSSFGEVQLLKVQSGDSNDYLERRVDESDCLDPFDYLERMSERHTLEVDTARGERKEKEIHGLEGLATAVAVLELELRN